VIAIEDRQWFWSSCEEQAATDVASLERCLFGMELPTGTLYVEGDALSEEVRAEDFGHAFVWKEPRDWFAPVRNMAEAVAADAQLFQVK
jgi:hypothetical protein